MPHDILLYTWSSCSFCARAKRLLEEAALPWREQVLDGDRPLQTRLAKVFGQATMPYVLLDGDPLGGLPELEAWLDRGPNQE